MFNIGSMQFYVASSTIEGGKNQAEVGGKVTQSTTIRLIKSVSADSQLECVILAPIKHHVSRREQVLAESLKPFFLQRVG